MFTVKRTSDFSLNAPKAFGYNDERTANYDSLGITECGFRDPNQFGGWGFLYRVPKQIAKPTTIVAEPATCELIRQISGNALFLQMFIEYLRIVMVYKYLSECAYYVIECAPLKFESSTGWIRDLTTECIEPNPGPLTNNRTRNNNNKKRKNKNNRRRTLPNKNPPYPITSPMVLQSVQPNSRMVSLDYELANEIFNTGTNNVVLDVYKLNSPYDWIQTLFTQTIQFLNYNFALYGRAKVISMDLRVTFGNLENVPIDIFWFEAPFNPVTSFPTRSAVESMAGTGVCKWRDTMSEQYGKKSQIALHRRVGIGHIIGNKKEYDGSGDYSCTATADPTKLVYGCWVAVSPLTSIPTGITARLSVSLRTLFYDIVNVNSPLLSRLSDDKFVERIAHCTRTRRVSVGRKENFI